MTGTVPPQLSGKSEPSTRRLMSLDALRGFAMFWILGGGSLAFALDRLGDDPWTRRIANQLRHVRWEGFHFYDLIFPLFIFIVGVSIVYSLGRMIESHGRIGALKKVFRRSLLIYCVGVFYSGGFTEPWPDVRLLGVLNRIAICYFFASLLYSYCSPRVLVGACVSLLVGYWALLTYVPFPDVREVDATGELISQELQTSSVEPLNRGSTAYLTGIYERGVNLANYVDQRYLPGKKLYGTWDPEGLLSTIPAVATCLLGVLAGIFLLDPAIVDRRKVTWLVGAGVAGVVAGFAWGLQFPVIKNVWTSSYVLVAGGYSAILLGLFYLVIDVLRFQLWCQPFVWIGMNSLALYLAENLLNYRSVSTRVFGGDVKALLDSMIIPGAGDTLISLGEIGVTILLAWFLFRRRIFLRL